jgi:hypothetical protein
MLKPGGVGAGRPVLMRPGMGLHRAITPSDSEGSLMELAAPAIINGGGHEHDQVEGEQEAVLVTVR